MGCLRRQQAGLAALWRQRASPPDRGAAGRPSTPDFPGRLLGARFDTDIAVARATHGSAPGCGICACRGLGRRSREVVVCRCLAGRWASRYWCGLAEGQGWHSCSQLRASCRVCGKSLAWIGLAKLRLGRETGSFLNACCDGSTRRCGYTLVEPRWASLAARPAHHRQADAMAMSHSGELASRRQVSAKPVERFAYAGQPSPGPRETSQLSSYPQPQPQRKPRSSCVVQFEAPAA